ncbi:MAG: protein jag [Clostridia bacterium]|nr:protein jag [Clostridia bacterium]
MQKYIEVTAKTEDEAVAAALNQLKLPREEVSIEIIERAKAGFLRIGASPAVIKVYYEAPDEPVRAAGPQTKSAAKSVEKAKPAAASAGQSQPKADSDTAGRARQFLDGLLEHMGIKAEIDITEKEDGVISIELSGEGMGAVIGRRGETLDAIQHLTNYAVNRGVDERTRISIDAENYRAKREEALVRLAEKMAAKTLKYKRSMALEPMNSYERHVIHTALQSFDGVTTCSTGTEPNRRVVISCEKPSQE